MKKLYIGLMQKLQARMDSIVDDSVNRKVLSIANTLIDELAAMHGNDEYILIANRRTAQCLLLNELEAYNVSVAYHRVLSEPTLSNLQDLLDSLLEGDEFCLKHNRDELQIVVKLDGSNVQLIDFISASNIESNVSFKLNESILRTGDYLVIHKPCFEGSVLVDFDYYVLEPDFLVDVTLIATSVNKSVGMSSLFTLNTLKPFVPNEHIYKGSLINSILDFLMTESERDFDIVFSHCRKQFVLEQLLFSNHEEKLRHEIEYQNYPTLVNIADRLSKFNVLIEPTYISTKFGLKGRFDLLIEDSNRGQEHLIELKGGKAPDFGSWFAHRVQTTCYDLMLTGSMDTARNGKSYILYSKAGVNNALRENKINADRVRELNNLRNEIVGLCRDYCTSNPFDDIELSGFQVCPDYIKRDVKELEAMYSELNAYEQRYVKSVLNYSFKEMWRSKTGYYNSRVSYGFNSLWRQSDSEKHTEFNIISGLLFESITDNEVSFTQTDSCDHRFRERDSVLIYPDLGDGFKNHYLRANYIGTNEGIVVVKLMNPYPESLLTQNTKWTIEPDAFDSNYYRMFRGVTSFISASARKRELLLGQLEPQYELQDPDLENVPTHLQDIIRNAISNGDYYLLQGPPGTGKTSGFIMNYLQVVLEQTDEVLYLSAFTNQAVGEICAKLADRDIPYLHLRSGSIKLDETKDISNVRVIVSTVHSFHGNGLMVMSLFKPSTLIVDEASQLLEQHLIGVLPHFKKFILIGDENQLPAVTTLSEEQGLIDNDKLNQKGIYNLKESLFKRLNRQAVRNDWSHCVGKLVKHYRMHDDIAKLVNCYYDNSLEYATARQRKESNAGRGCFVNVSKSGTPFRSESEAGIAASIALEYKDYSCGIIVAFRAQISLVQEALHELCIDDITVDTVERFQGSERDIIIFTPAINSIADFERVQSLDSEGKVDRKLNVAISRARESFFLLGDRTILSCNSHYKRLLEQLTDYRPEF